MEAQGLATAGKKSLWNAGPLWLAPLVVLVALGLALSFLVYRASGGREIADDTGMLVRFAREPFVLWGNYGAAGLRGMWGSFPPLLPLLFGALVRPWLEIAPEFWGFRLGILTWSVVVLLALHFALKREDGVSEGRRRFALLLFAVLPSVLGAIAFIPQEEIYVSLFCLALYAAAAKGRWNLVFILLVLSAFAAKYFLLALAVPLAFKSDAPIRKLALWGGTIFVLLAAYVWYHQALFGLTPIIGHIVDPSGSISIWALIWHLGVVMDPKLAGSLSLALVAALVLGFCFAGRRSGISLRALMAGTIYIALLGLSITVPAYILWNVPLVLICIALMRVRRQVVCAVALLFLWGVGEWGANFFRGVKFALDTDRPEGKEALAKLAERFLGAGFPYHAAHIACIGLVLASGVAQICLLWAAGKERRAHPC